MALSDKNILIIPSIGASTGTNPRILFTGADVTSSATITLSVYNSGTQGTVSFSGNSGQLFSITDSMAGTIFSVNDISGIPSIEVLDTGLVKLAQYNGSVAISTSTAVSGYELTVFGGTSLNGNNQITGITTVTNTTAATNTTTGALVVAGGVGIGANLYVGGEIVAQKLTIQLTTVSTTLIETDDIIRTLNTTNATSSATGALQISGGAGIVKDLYVGGIIYGTVSGAINTATNLANGAAGTIAIQNTAGSTSFIAAGSSGQILVYGTNTATWTNTSSIYVSRATVADSAVSANSAFVATTSTNLAGGSLGAIPYQTAAGLTAFIGTGTTGQVLTMGANTATWTSAGAIVAGNATTATNIAGGNAGLIVLQTGAGRTGFIGSGTSGQILVQGTNTATWTNTGSIYVYRATLADSVTNAPSASLATTATNISGGTAGQVPYQTGPGLTSFYGPGNIGQLLQSNGTSAPSYVNTASVHVGTAVYASSAGSVTNATNAANIATIAQTGNASYFLTFVDTNNAASANEPVYTTSSFVVNPATGNVGIGASSPTKKLDVRGNALFTATSAPTDDIVTISNLGFPVATAGANALQVSYVGGIGAIEASAVRADMTPGSTSTSIWNAFRVAATAAAATGVTFNGVKFDSKTAGAGTSNALWVGTGYDTILSYSGTTVINGTGQVIGGQVLGAVETATNIDGGSAGRIPIQSGAGVTSFVPTGSNGQVLTWSGSTATWSTPSGGTTLNTVAATSATPFFLTFVDSNNATSAAESFYTTSSIYVVPSTGDVYTTGTIYNNGVALLPSRVEEFTATAGQTTFTVTGGYTVNTVQVFANGVALGSTDFTASNGTTIVLTNPRFAGDIVRVVAAATSVNNNATNIIGGTSNQILYQSAANTTNFITAPTTASTFLRWTGSGFDWQSATTASVAVTVLTGQQTDNASYYLTFVNSNDATPTADSLYTTSSFVVNPSTGNVGLGNTSPGKSLVIGDGTGSRVIELRGGNSLSSGTSINFFHGGSAIGAIGNKSTILGTGYSNEFVVYSANDATIYGGGNEAVRVTSTGSVGIGTATPGARLDIVGGGVRIANNQALFFRRTDGDDTKAAQLFVNTSNSLVGITAGGWQFFTASGSTSTRPEIVIGDSTVNCFIADGLNGRLYFNANGNEAMRIDSSQNLHIGGTANATSKLQVTGTARFSGVTTVTNTTNATSTITGAFQVEGGVGIGGNLYVGGTVVGTSSLATTSTNIAGGSAGRIPIQSSAGVTSFIAAGITNGHVLTWSGTTATWSAAPGGSTVETTARSTSATHYLTFVPDNNTTATAETVYTTSSFAIDPSTGNVGIGTTATTYKLNVFGPASGNIVAGIYDSSAFGAGTGGGIAFGGYISSSSIQDFASIKGRKANSASADNGGTLEFQTRKNGDGFLSTRMAIDSLGNVGIGTISPSAALDVIGSVEVSSTVTTKYMVVTSGIMETSAAITENYTVTNNGLSVGPISINTGVTVTVANGAVWTVV